MTSASRETCAAEIIVDPVAMSGRFNMAMDAALLEFGAAREVSVVRIYQWKSPTVTLGYFQAANGKAENPFPELDCVRRLSGGGAILHDQELTYSCVLPGTHPIRHDPSQLYETIHRGLIRLLKSCGANCCLRSEHHRPSSTGIDQADRGDSTGEIEPFLCFLRSNPNDIVHQSGHKIVGSAQRRRKGVTLQHGSILMSASRITPDLPGLSQISPDFNVRQFHDRLPVAIAETIASQLTFRTYTPEEIELASEIERNESDRDSVKQS